MSFKNFKTIFFYGFLYFLFPSVAYAELSGTDFKISTYTASKDKQYSNDIHSIIHSKAFAPVSESNQAKNEHSWIKIEWDKNKITNEQFLLNNDFDVNQHQTYFLIKNNQVLAKYKNNETKLKNQEKIKHFKPLIDVGKADYVLAQICCSPQFSQFFYLLSDNEVAQDYHDKLLGYAVAYALIALMILYNFCIWVYLRNKKYLFYCLYLSTAILGLLSLSGLGSLLLWSDRQSFFLIFYNYNNSSLYSMSSILFITSFLDKTYFSKGTIKLINATLIYCAVTSLLWLSCYTLGLDEITKVINKHQYVAETVTLLGFVVNYYVIVHSLVAGDSKAKTLFLSYSIITLGMVVMTLRNHYVLPDNLWTIYALEIAFVVEAVILSLVLAQNVQRLRQENLLMEKKQQKLQQQFSWQLIEEQEEEKKQIGSTLHENYTHQLLILKNNLLKKIGPGSEVSDVEKILNEIKTLSYLIHPYTIEKLGLEAALSEMTQKLMKSDNFDINLSLCGCDLSKEQNLIVFRIIQEALNNIIEHANAEECIIALKCKQSLATIIIKDDGDGFHVGSNNGFGIKMLKERCKKLSGSISIQSNSHGTTITITFPVNNTILNNQLNTNNHAS